VADAAATPFLDLTGDFDTLLIAADGDFFLDVAGDTDLAAVEDLLLRPIAPVDLCFRGLVD
jgi:hypothetical protein